MNEKKDLIKEQSRTGNLLSYTAHIVSAHLSNNRVETGEVPALIQQVYTCLLNLESKTGEQIRERPEPIVPIHKSVKSGYIICLEDGKKLKMLKRHLKTAYNMTPEEYRERWGLSMDYPMVAPDYAKQRSALAKNIGLGRKNRKKSSKITSAKSRVF